MNKRLKWVAFSAILVVLALILLSTPQSKTARRLPTGSTRPSVAIGDNHAVILASDGSLWTWGENGFGWQVLGLGSNVSCDMKLHSVLLGGVILTKPCVCPQVLHGSMRLMGCPEVGATVRGMKPSR